MFYSDLPNLPVYPWSAVNFFLSPPPGIQYKYFHKKWEPYAKP